MLIRLRMSSNRIVWSVALLATCAAVVGAEKGNLTTLVEKVMIANDPAHPLSADVESAARTELQFPVDLSTTPAESFDSTNAYTVPSGSVLVVDSIGVQGTSQNPGEILTDIRVVDLNPGTNQVYNTLVCTALPDPAVPNEIRSDTHQATLYVEAGNTLLVTARRRTGSQGTATTVVDLSATWRPFPTTASGGGSPSPES